MLRISVRLYVRVLMFLATTKLIPAQLTTRNPESQYISDRRFEMFCSHVQTQIKPTPAVWNAVGQRKHCQTCTLEYLEHLPWPHIRFKAGERRLRTTITKGYCDDSPLARFPVIPSACWDTDWSNGITRAIMLSPIHNPRTTEAGLSDLPTCLSSEAASCSQSLQPSAKSSPRWTCDHESSFWRWVVTSKISAGQHLAFTALSSIHSVFLLLGTPVRYGFDKDWFFTVRSNATNASRAACVLGERLKKTNLCWWGLLLAVVWRYTTLSIMVSMRTCRPRGELVRHLSFWLSCFLVLLPGNN